MNWTTFVFAHMLKSRLRRGVVRTPDASHFLVSGALDIGAVIARIEIRVSKSFEDVLRKPPRVWCREPWMRSESDWHNDDVRGMCWVLDNEWRDVLSPEGRQERDLVAAGTEWLIDSVRSLASRHYYAHRVGLTAWPKEWVAWGHNSAGVLEYERLKNRRQ
jgi:hypothetical protein